MINDWNRLIKMGSFLLCSAGIVLTGYAQEIAPNPEKEPVSITELATEWSPVLSTEKMLFTVDEPVIITYRGLPGHAQDWISVVPAGSADDVYSRNWTYTHGITEGEYTVKEPLSPGEYEARVYFDYPNGGLVVQKRHIFHVAAAAPSEPAADNQAESMSAERAQRMLGLRAQFICNTIAEIPKTECLALFDLYNSTQGNQWRRNEGWNRTNRPCQWHGIQCEQGHITALNLPNNNLLGTLPDLSAFTQLKALWLSNNQLTGELPPLEKLTNLQKLYLNGNEFTGQVPALNALQQLRVLHLYDNAFSGQIPELSALSQLEIFYAYDNQFSGLMPALTNLSALRELNLSFNQLTGELPDLNAAPNLHYFAVEFNQLSGQFPDIRELFGLEGLYLDSNHFCGEIPSPILETHPFLSLTLNGNGFYTEDESMIDFLNEIDSTWAETQTACEREETLEEEARVEENNDDNDDDNNHDESLETEE